MEQSMYIAPVTLKWRRVLLVTFIIMCVILAAGVIIRALMMPMSLWTLLPVLPASWLLFLIGATHLDL